MTNGSVPDGKTLANISGLDVSLIKDELELLKKKGIISSFTFDEVMKLMPHLISLSTAYDIHITNLGASADKSEEAALNTIKTDLDHSARQMDEVISKLETDEARVEVLRILSGNRSDAREKITSIFNSGLGFKKLLLGAGALALVGTAAILQNRDA